MKHIFLENVGKLFFWVPLFLALLDLIYFILTPLMVFFALDPNSSFGWQFLLISISEDTGFGVKDVVLFIVLVLSLLRVGVINGLKRIFSNSLSQTYTALTDIFVSAYMNAISDLKFVENDRFRKVLNAETNNLFFGVVVSISFAIAELLVVIVAVIVVLNVFGIFVLIGILPLILMLGGGLYLIRKRSQLIGKQRSDSEQKRLGLVELLICSGYSIEKNSGRKYFEEKIHSSTKDFSEALSLQLVLPHLTKSVVDAVLLLMLVVIVFRTSDVLGAAETALLIGVGFRAVPALSRMSSYLETIRINRVGAQDALDLVMYLEKSSVSSFECKNVVQFLEGINTCGIYVVKGPSGVGKTTAIKKWISNLDSQEISYFDQGGFSSSTELGDLFGLLNIKSDDALNDIGFLNGRSEVYLSKLSGGQARYIQLAMLLTKNVQFVVLDEPSVGLDAELKLNLEFLIKQKSKTSKVVVITHDNDFINGLLAESKGELCEIKT